MRLSIHQQRYINYVRDHPYCCAADINRHCKSNPQAGHRWVYNGVKRLVRRGLLIATCQGSKVLLRLPDKCDLDIQRSGK